MERLKISLAKIFRRRNIETEENDQLSVPFDPADDVVVCTSAYVEPRTDTCAYVEPRASEVGLLKTDEFASSSSDTTNEIERLEELLGADYKLKDVRVPVPKFCIYKVPKNLRKINRQAYTPQIISIGPLHHGNKALVEMEKQKLIYLLEFQKREGAEKLKKFKKFIEDKVQHIRDCYQENSRLSDPKFVNMILLDAVFIIVFFSKNEQQERDFFLDTTCVKVTITRDLQLLENQLPYFLLKELFVEGHFRFQNLTEEQEKKNPDHFLTLCHRFFFNSGNHVLPEPNYQIQHFTDLRRYFMLMDFMDFPPGDQKRGEHVRDLPTATKLQGSGVKFKGIEGGSSLKITCDYREGAMRIPFIKDLTLQIPRFEIDDQSECLYRNMMALELCHYPSETHICNVILLMDFLINTEKDVDLFVEEEIIFSLLGDNAKVAKMFNSLCLQITPSPSVYHNIGHMLKEHYKVRWNRTMATLKTVYFGDIWTSTATGAAILLLVLTFAQTICSILSLL